MPALACIHFQSQCATAMAFYAQVFGGTDLQLMGHADGPGAPEAWKASPRVMHAQVTIRDGTQMASDYPPGTTGNDQRGFSVMQSAPDVVSAHRVFGALCDQGTVIDPIKSSFISPAFGMVQDRFGTRWIIPAMQQGAAS